VASAHPCETEISSACPTTPPSDMAECLNHPAEHETKTEISSECTDFMALNKACKDDIKKHCDEAFFTDDTILCLTSWVDKDNLENKCQSVLKWAVPKDDDEGEVTDELGMSQQDIDEKEEWRAKRKAARGDSIARMKMKETDRKKEDDRVALEEFKKTNPEGYAQMIQQQEEEAKQQKEFKRQERARAAAWERKQKKDSGVEDEDEAAAKPQKAAKKKKGPYPWYVPYAAMLAVAAVIYAVFKSGIVKGFKASGKSGGGNKGKKKR